MDASLKERKKQILEIRRTLDAARDSAGYFVSLRMNRASFFAILGMSSVFVIEWVAEQLGWPSEQASSFIFGFMPILLGGTAGYYWGFNTAKYKTYSAKLYALLAAYGPVDPFAYRKLQEAARLNTLSYDTVLDWWYMENALVTGPPAPAEADPFKARFIEKNLEDASTPFLSSGTGADQAGPQDYAVGRHYIYRLPATGDAGFLSDDPIHKIVLETRYALESAADRLRIADDQKGHEVGVISKALPYFWSGGRDKFDPVSAELHIDTVRVVIARYGLDLPTTREDALTMLLRLSAHLLDPHPNTLLEQLQESHGLTKSAAR